jgi:hypothetical protein
MMGNMNSGDAREKRSYLIKNAVLRMNFDVAIDASRKQLFQTLCLHGKGLKFGLARKLRVRFLSCEI